MKFEEWDTVAKDLGYASSLEMFRKMYEKSSIQGLARTFNVPTSAIRNALKACKIEFRKRGGPRFKLYEMNQEILDEITNKGIEATAKRLGVTKFTLYQRRRKFLIALGFQNPVQEPETPPEASQE